MTPSILILSFVLKKFSIKTVSPFIIETYFNL